jgi:hypothetical protein
MGTNYYWAEQEAPCACCGRSFQPIHIGKSSGGWCFLLHVIPEDGIHDLADWEACWAKPGSIIEDEYGTRLSPETMRAIITVRSWPRDAEKIPLGYESWGQFYDKNSADLGPNGLLRHRVDGRFCVGNGAGTWDLIAREFS